MGILTLVWLVLNDRTLQQPECFLFSEPHIWFLASTVLNSSYGSGTLIRNTFIFPLKTQAPGNTVDKEVTPEAGMHALSLKQVC